MSDRHDEEEEPQLAHDESNWLVSYADMMTLLFGFFILMYSMSRVDDSKFTIVSKDVAKYFGGKVKDDAGVQILTKDVKNFIGTFMKAIPGKAVSAGEADQTLAQSGNNEDIPPEKAVDIEEGPNTLVLKFKGSILFGSGSAQIKPDFEKMLTELGQKLKASQRVQEIRVEGHTDDSAIKSAVFPNQLGAFGITCFARDSSI